jgi:glycosyl transferase family 2
MAVTVSIIIPVKPGGRVKALEAVRHLECSGIALEVLVAEGRRPSRQRNRAAELASGEILYFLDDDSLADPGNLGRLGRHFSVPGVAAVGGPSLTPADDSPWQQGFGLALAALFGGGGVRNRYRQAGATRATDDREIILCNLAMRAEVFRAMGGLDERLYPNEENELLVRIGKAGATILHDPELAVHRSQRPDFRAFVRQLFTYGRGRGEQTLISGAGGAATFIPSLFLLYLGSLLFIHNPVYSVPLLCYAVGLSAFSLHEAVRAGRPALAALLAVIFPALHLAYGAGLLVGLAVPRFRRGQPASGEVQVRVVKPLSEGWPAENTET